MILRLKTYLSVYIYQHVIVYMLVHYIVIALVNKCLAMSTGLDGQDDHVNEFVLVFDSQPNFLPLGQ